MGSWKYEGVVGNYQEDTVKEQTLAVVTRSQSNQRKIKPLITVKEIDTELSRDDLKRLQKEDETLKAAWKRTQEKPEMGKHNQFVAVGELLYRQGRRGSRDM